MSRDGSPRWWTARLAQNRKPATYRCPLCGEQLPALSQHMLLFPEDDHSRRRHAHTECVMRARRAGRLPTRDEWLAPQRRADEPEVAQPRRLGMPARLLRRLRRTPDDA